MAVRRYFRADQLNALAVAVSLRAPQSDDFAFGLTNN
jgi:hypothetical protein